MPGAPSDLPVWHPWLRFESGPFAQTLLLMDAVDEYMMLVARRLDPGAHWGILGGKRRRIPDAEYHATGYVNGKGDYLKSGSPGRTVVRATAIGLDSEIGVPGGYFFSWLGTAPAVPERRGASVLRDLLAQPATPPADRVPPPELPRGLIDFGGVQRAPASLMVAAGSSTRDLEAMPPLDATTVATALSYAGFRLDDRRVEAGDLQVDRHLVHLNGYMAAAVVTMDGRPRGVLVETSGLGSEMWAGVRAALTDSAGAEVRWVVPNPEWLGHAVRRDAVRPPAALPPGDVGTGKRLVLAIPLSDSAREPGAAECAAWTEVDVWSALGALGVERVGSDARANTQGRRSLDGGGALTVEAVAGDARQLVIDIRDCSPDRVAELTDALAPLADRSGARMYLDGRRLDRNRDPLPLAHVPLDRERMLHGWDDGSVFVLSDQARSTHPARLPELDPALITEVLKEAGVIVDGRPVRVSDLVDRNRLKRPETDWDSTLYIGVGVDRGALRVLRLFEGDRYDDFLPSFAEQLPRAGAMLVIGDGTGGDKNARKAYPWATWFDDLEDVEVGAGEYVIADGPLAADGDDPYSALRPLPVAALAALFRELGAVPPRGDFDEVLLTTDGTELYVGDGIVTFLITVRDGMPRAVDIDQNGPTDDEWRAIYGPISRFLDATGLTLRLSELAYAGIEE